MAAGQTYEPIATITLPGTTSFSFGSIPQTYTDLVLVVAGVAPSGVNFNLRFNGDTGTNYSYTQLTGNGSTASSSRLANSTYARVDYYGYLDTARSVHIVHILNYSNSSIYKNIISRGSNANNGTSLVANTWRSTAAITSVSSSGVTDLGAGSVITLFGIAAA